MAAVVWCRRCRPGQLIVVLIIVGFMVACYNAETVTGMFGKSEQDVCTDENCTSEKKTQVDAESAGGPGGQGTQREEPRSPQTGKTEPKTSLDPKKESDPEAINLIITFTNADGNPRLQEKFTLTVSSLLERASVPLKIHVIGDDRSQSLAADLLRGARGRARSTYSLVRLDVDQLARQLSEVVRPMQDHFSYKPGAYYNHALFFLSIAIHKVMPENMKRVIMIDCDLKFKADIKELYDRFDTFEKDNIMGIGRDMQPVYRHTFWSYRNKHPNTRVGEPPPNGLTGFNSGVLLLDLDRMRASELYNSLLNRQALEQLTGEFEFKGHLGDQDFFSLLSMKYERLFHVLPCAWNRQLCTWWREHGYQAVFDQYFTCEGPVKIYHGNCNTPIPDD